MTHLHLVRARRRRLLLGCLGTLSLAFSVGCVDPSDSLGEGRTPARTRSPGAPISGPDDSGDTEPSAPLSDRRGPSEVEEAPAPDPAPATKKVLDFQWYGQETYYWCGPASTRMALGTRIANPPSQTELANEMGTTTNGTDHIGLPARVLNEYFAADLGANAYEVRPMNDPPTQEQRELLKKDLVARIDAGFPIVANVVSGWRPPGYPSGTIYHYVTIVGYDEGGEKVLIADPAAEGKGGGARWQAVPRSYWISLQDLGTWIGGKGYTG